jgi:hypothetical protein
LWPGLPFSIAEYQRNGDLNVTIKAILTVVSIPNRPKFPILNYFANDYNQNVAPGDVLWQPIHKFYPEQLTWLSPRLSNQIFSDYMDISTLTKRQSEIPGTNITQTRGTFTTTDNPAFGVTAGQKVSLLILTRTENDIPISILTPESAQKSTLPMIDAATEIVTSTELLAAVRSFLADS